VLEELPSQWDYVIIDCPPGLELLTLNALVAADEVIIPSPTEELPTRGLKAMWQFISEIRRARLNESLCVLGVLPTMHIKNVRLHWEVLGDLQANLGDKVFKTIIRRNTRLGEAPAHNLPIHLYAKSSHGSADYMRLAQEVDEQRRRA